MTYQELTDEVTAAVKEASASRISMIPDIINESLGIIAGEITLPSLRTVTSVTSVLLQNWTVIGGTFDGQLRYVGTSDGPVIVLDGGVEALLEKFPALDEVGNIHFCALEGNILYYQGIPTVETAMTIVIYNNPTLLVGAVDVPSFLPLPLHRGLIVNKSAQIMYERMEDGMMAEEERISASMRCQAHYEDAKDQLNVWLAKRRGHVGRSNWWIL